MSTRISAGQISLPTDRWFIPLAVLLAATALLRLPSYSEPPWYGDEGIFAAVAHGMLVGGRLYADVWDSKPPLIFLVYALTLKLFGPQVFPLRLATTAVVLATQVILFLIGRQLSGLRRGLLAAAIFGLLTGVPFWEGNLALTEVFMALPLSSAVLWYVWREERSGEGTASLQRDVLTYGGVGLLIAVGTLFRQTGGVLLLTFIAWVLAVHRFRLRRLAILCLAFALPWGGTSLYFLLQGTFAAYWYANVGFFLIYIPSGYRLSGLDRFFIALPSLTVLLWLLIRRQRLRESRLLPFLLLWFTTALAGALIAGRPYGHYLIQAFAPLALLLASIRLPLSLRAGATLVPGLVAVQTAWLLFGVYHSFVHLYRANSPGYYVNYVKYILGIKSERLYNDFFDWHVNRMFRMQAALEAAGARGRTAFIWGEYPWLYVIAGLKPVTRFPTSAYAQDTPLHWPEFKAALVKERPEFIVVAGDAKIPFPFLESFIAEHYQSVGWVQGSRIYRIVEESFDDVPSGAGVVERRRRALGNAGIPDQEPPIP